MVSWWYSRGAVLQYERRGGQRFEFQVLPSALGRQGGTLAGFRHLGLVLLRENQQVKFKCMQPLWAEWKESVCMAWMCLRELWRQVAGVWRSRRWWGWGRHGMKHCAWCLRPWRERSGMWKLGICSFEEAWGHQDVIRNCVKTTAKPRLSWEWSIQLVEFLFLYHLQHKLNPIHHY